MDCLYISKYTIIRKLSTGGFSNVYLVKHDSSYFALKLMKTKNNYKKYFENEYCILKSLKHPFICNCIEFISIYYFKGIILNYIQGDELYYVLHRKGHLSYSETLQYGSCILSAIIYLHDLKIIYRDIKPENVIIHNNKAVMVDFGFAKSIYKFTNTYCGTYEYMAPEIKNRKPYSFSADMYSFGVLLYEMYTGEFPYMNKCHIQIPNELNECIFNLLSPNHLDRKTANALRWSYCFYNIDFDSLVQES